MTAKFDVIVIGAGVIGMCTALALAKRGREVLIIERGIAGRESSWAGAGLLAPMRPWDYPESIWQLCRESRALYPALATELQQATGIDVQLLECGAYLHDPSCMERAQTWHKEQGLRYSIEQEGGREWLNMPWYAQIRNPRLAKALRTYLPELGISLREGVSVTGLLQGNNAVQGVAATFEGQSASVSFHADEVVVAAGAWSGSLTESAPQVEPVRGQMLLLRLPRPLPPAIWLLPECYLVVRADGRCLLGATVEHVGFDKSITREARVHLLESACRVLPELKRATIEMQWAGLRPGIAGGEPVIRADASARGLWWNVGHFRNGLAMAPASGAAIARKICAPC